MVEQRPFKALVEGSSPSLSTNFFMNLAQYNRRELLANYRMFR